MLYDFPTILRSGEIILDSVKYSTTAFAEVEGMKIGHILCDELIVQRIKGEDYHGVDLFVHPIGVGMLSNEQFEE
ncbi:hypothetical protein [Halalkalibacter sp. APA_J-10(15)]|nr:hypothetical protein [Halalkalibacter sp. APA_J-10(15)]